MREPRTKAGRELVADLREVLIHGVRDRFQPGFSLVWEVQRLVLAIEAEAAAPSEASTSLEEAL